MLNLAAFDELERQTPDRPPHWMAALVFGLMGLSFIGLICGDIALPAFPPLVTVFITGVLIVDATTAVMLMAMFYHWRRLSYAILAAAYLFSSLQTLPFILTFPGFAEHSGSILGGAQSAVWVWQVWHIVFPALIGLSALGRTKRGHRLVAPKHAVAVLAGICLGVGLLVALLGLAVTVGAGMLPQLLNLALQAQTPSFFTVSGLCLIVDTAAAVAIWRQPRPHTLLTLWLLVTLAAFAGDVLTSMAAIHRYTIGWYISRVQGLIGSGVMFAFLVTEAGVIYQRMRAALIKADEERKRLWQDTQSVRMSERRYRLLTTGIKDCAIYMLDPRGRVVTWNEGAERLKGYSERQINGRTIHLFFTPEDVAAKKPEALLDRSKAQGHVEDEGWRLRKDGSRFYAKVMINALRDAGGELVGFAVMTWDAAADHRALDHAPWPSKAV